MGIVKIMRQFANDTKRNALIFAQPNALLKLRRNPYIRLFPNAYIIAHLKL